MDEMEGENHHRKRCFNLRDDIVELLDSLRRHYGFQDRTATLVYLIHAHGREVLHGIPSEVTDLYSLKSLIREEVDLYFQVKK